MTLKPPTRTFPKLVMKEWPEKDKLECARDFVVNWDKALSDFTRVVEETGILDQGRSSRSD